MDGLYRQRLPFPYLRVWYIPTMYVLVCVYTAKATSKAVSDPEGARKLGRASVAVSITGIVVDVILIILIFIYVHISLQTLD